MKELTDKEYWNSKYEPKVKVKLSGLRGFQYYEILKMIQPFMKGSNIIEIGCAPGNLLLDIAKTFNLEPYGVEYAPKGAEMTKDNFKANGFEEKNVILADFFDEKFQNDNKEKYDIVASFGFIEHFDNTNEVIKKHMNLLKKEGILILTIPNMKKGNRFFFTKDILNKHNLSIMEPKELGKRVPKELEIKLLGYHGGFFNFGLFFYRSRFLENVRRVFSLLQKLTIDPLSMLLLKAGIRLNNKWFSPSIMLIGTKK